MTTVRVRLVGGLAVERDGRPLPDAQLANRRARLLLALLAAEHGSTVTLDRIVEVLWPGRAAPRRPADNVAVMVSRLRRSLGGQCVTGGRAGYALARSVRVDITDAAELASEAHSRLAADEPALAGAAATTALDLLEAGDVLPGTDGEWVRRLRERTTAVRTQARYACAEAGLATGDPAAAQEAARAALAADPLDELAARQLMHALVAAGEPARALAVFDALRAVLAASLGVDPAPQTRELHVRILREDAFGPRKDRRGAVRPLRSRLAGRAPEIAALTAAWTNAVDGTPALALLTGEAGIGKTRLLDETVAVVEATGGRVLRSRCYETERSLFLQPIVDALEPAVAALRPDQLRRVAEGREAATSALFAETRPLFRQGPLERGSAHAQKRQSYEAICALLRALAEERPVLLAVDDLHQAGLATAELLHYLPRHLHGARVLAVAALRAEEGAEVHRRLAPIAQVLTVGPLDAAAIGELARRAGVGELAEPIAARTGGHPLFVVESLRALAAGESGIPESLREAVLQRVARAGAQSEELLRAAAVVGLSFEPSVVGGLLGLGSGDAARRCEQLLATRLVAVSGRAYEFAHDLVHEVLYASTPEPTRLSYHRAAADLLADRPEAVAGHAAATGDWPRAARAWTLAAEQAAGRYASDDAERLLDRALDAAQRASEVNLMARVLAARGGVREIAGRYRDAERDLRDALQLARDAGDRHLEMRVARRLGGDVIVSLGYPIGECERMLSRALALAGELGDHAAEADALSRLAVLAVNQLRFDVSSERAARAVRAAQTAGDEWATILALDGEKATLAYLGDVGPLEAKIDRLEHLLRRRGDLFLLQWTVFESSFIPFARGDWAQATARIEEALELNRRSGHVAYSGWLHAHLGWIERMQGRYEAAIACGRRSIEGTRALPYAWWNTFAHAMLATTLAETGEVEEAIGWLTEGLRLADRGGTPAYRLRCLALLAQLTGSPDVLAEADEVLASVTVPAGRAWLHGIDAYVAVAQAHLDHGALDAARRVIDPVAAAARDCGHRVALEQAELVSRRASQLRAARPATPPLGARRR